MPSDLVKEGDEIKIAWRRNKGSLKTQAVKVTDGSATVNQSLSLNTEMVYDKPTKSFISKLTQIEVLEAKSMKVFASADLDLAKAVHDEAQQVDLDFELITQREENIYNTPQQ